MRLLPPFARVYLFCAVLVTGLNPAPSQACANFKSKETSLDGSAKSVGKQHLVRQLQAAMKTDLYAKGAELASRLESSTGFDDRNDYSVALIYLRRAPEAVKLLRQLEVEHPGTYSVAANLGTALELSGNDTEALEWIREGVRRNPDSHDGTEWLHVKILEAKIANVKDPQFLHTHSVLGLKAEDLRDSIQVGGEVYPWQEVEEAMLYQLKERLQFVKPADPAVAALLYDFAAIAAAHRTLETAVSLLTMAETYGLSPARLAPLRTEYQARIHHRQRMDTFKTTGLILGGTGLIAMVAWAMRRSRGAASAEAVT